jgi:triosephosphate isomerase
MLPEALIFPAIETLSTALEGSREGISIGCQGVYREDTALGGNFGAFTANRPAAAMKAAGCTWVMNGHSEERRDKLNAIAIYDPTSQSDVTAGKKAAFAVEKMLNAQNNRAFDRGLNVLFCVGETAEQKGSNIPEEYESRVKAVLRAQLEEGLRGIAEHKGDNALVVAYEPIWAIGPGKTPPNADYISFVSSYIKDICGELYGFRPDVVYGGGLKEENAAEIASIKTIDGGLVALTQFVEPIAFSVESFKRIIEAYVRT